MMNFNQLTIFHAVAEEESISRGADRLFISQPAVSKQLADLEKSLGLRLFDRHPKGARLTDAGKLLHDYTRRLFVLEREAETALAEMHGLERGRLSVGSSTTIGNSVLPGVMAAFHRRYSGIELHLEIANTSKIQQWLIEGSLDLGLTEGFVDSPELEADVFLEDELVAITYPHHSLLAEAPLSAARLCQEPFVAREQGSGLQAVVERALGEKGLQMKPSMTLGSTEAVKRAVALGAGVAIVSSLTVGLEREAGRLAVIELSDLSIRRPLHRLRLRGRHESRGVQAFMDRLRRSINSRAWKAYQRI